MKKNTGFTLLEVLIALAILAISLSAIILAISENARSVGRLKDRTMAHWVAMDVISGAQINLIPSPGAGRPEIGTSETLGKTWYWTLNAISDPAKFPLQVRVDVKAGKEDETPVVQLTGFLKNAEKIN